jgi:hypothetical protein
MADDDRLSIREWRLLYSISMKKAPVYAAQLKALGFADEAESLRQRDVLEYLDAKKSYQINSYGQQVVDANPQIALPRKELLFDPPGVK